MADRAALPSTRARTGSPTRAGYVEKKYVRLLVAVVCSGLVVAYCVRHASDLRLLLRLGVHDIAILLLLTASANLILAYTLFIMLKWLGLQGMGVREWMRLFTTSRLANFYVTQGGNVYRAVRLKKDYAFSYSKSIGITAALTGLHVASVLAVTGLVVLAAGSFSSPAGFIMLGLSLGLAGALAALPHLAARMARVKGRDAGERRAWLGDRMGVIADAVARCAHSARALALVSATSVFIYLTYVAGTLVCLRAFGKDVSFVGIALLASTLLLSQAIKVVPGNIGISELIAGASAAALMDGMMYGVMVAAILRFADYALIGALFLVFTCLPPSRRAGRTTDAAP